VLQRKRVLTIENELPHRCVKKNCRPTATVFCRSTSSVSHKTTDRAKPWVSVVG
jgi:hypothetical protein